jgi:hypothetical protein
MSAGLVCCLYYHGCEYESVFQHLGLFLGQLLVPYCDNVGNQL